MKILSGNSNPVLEDRLPPSSVRQVAHGDAFPDARKTD